MLMIYMKESFLNTSRMHVIKIDYKTKNRNEQHFGNLIIIIKKISVV